MSNFKLSALRSGSSGNLYLIESASTRLVLDCGVNGKQFATALAEAEIPEDEIKKISGILITHEHSDHICGLGVVMRRYGLPVYMNRATYMAARPRLGKIDEDLFHLIDNDTDFVIGDIKAKAFSVSHDAADPVGYTFETDYGKAAFCTDTGIVDDHIVKNLKGSDIVFIETNYEPDLLAVGPYPYHLKQRIKSEHGHLSNSEGASVCRTLLEAGSEKFVLSHLSQENNYPAIARIVVEEIIDGQDAKSGKDYILSVANRYKASPKIILK